MFKIKDTQEKKINIKRENNDNLVIETKRLVDGFGRGRFGV